MFWLRGDAQQRQSTYRMPTAAGDWKEPLKSIAMKLVFCESSGESSQPPPVTHSEQKIGVRGLLVSSRNSSAAADLLASRDGECA